MSTIIETNKEIQKEAANPFSHALIKVRSLNDPFRDEIKRVRELVSDAVNSLDTSLYLAATGSEKHTRSITENMSAFKRTISSIARFISNDVARKILEQSGVKPPFPYEDSSSIDSSVQETATELGTPNTFAPEEEKKIGIQSAQELVVSVTKLLSDYESLRNSTYGLLHASVFEFSRIEKRNEFKVELERTVTLTEAVRGIKERCRSILNSLSKGVDTPLASGDLTPFEILEKMIEPKTITKSNFKEALETYNKLRNIYGREYRRYDEAKHDLAMIKKGVDSIVGTTPKDEGNNPPAGPVVAGLHNGAIIVVADSYDRMLLNFMLKHASEPSIFQKLHTKVNEVGQDIIAPISDKVKRRTKIRRAIKLIKKATINLLVEIRRTAGKKGSIEEEINRWDSIITSLNELGTVLNKEFGITLGPQLALSNADLYNQKITEMKSLPDQRGVEQQRHMVAIMDAFQEPIPRMPTMKELMSRVNAGKPWGMKRLRQFE